MRRARAVEKGLGAGQPSAASDISSLRVERGKRSRAIEAALRELLSAEEAERAHGFAALIALLALAVSLLLPFVSGDPTAKLLCTGALALMGLVSAWVWYITRVDRASYTPGVHRFYGWTLVCGVLAVEYYAGFFSPVPVVLTLGIYYFAQSSDRTHALVLPLSVLLTYAAGALLVTFGYIEDRGLFYSGDVDLFTRLFAVVSATAVLAVTLSMARVARKTLRDAIARSNDALLVAQQREAQLAEAQQQLDRALRAAIGKPGRYTGAVAGCHRLGVVVGVGAIGEVYEAEHVETAKPAAVKLLQPDALAREDLVERFLREAEISSRLDSPNVVRVSGFGTLDNGAPFLAMELLEGRDLAARLRSEGRLPLRELASLASQLGAGLSHAHAMGIVHRDLKPLNVFEVSSEHAACWKILDFGISKLSTSAGTLTQEGVVGTPGYMSPEQARGAHVDHRSDVFSLGLVLYRAMTGQPAFPGDSTPQIMFDVVYKAPLRPSAVRRSLPHDIDLVMSIALAKEPGLRFDSATEFAEAFREAAERRLSPATRRRAVAVQRRYPWGFAPEVTARAASSST